MVAESYIDRNILPLPEAYIADISGYLELFPEKKHFARKVIAVSMTRGCGSSREIVNEKDYERQSSSRCFECEQRIWHFEVDRRRAFLVNIPHPPTCVTLSERCE